MREHARRMPRGEAAHNPAECRGEGPPKASGRHRPSGADRHRPKGRSAGRPPGRVACARAILHNRDMATSADTPQPAALREALTPELEIAQLTAALEALREDQQRSECMAAIQRDAVQLALDLLVTHPDLRGFFRAFIKRLVDDSEAHACGVWLVDDISGATDLWMANISGETLMADSAGWASLDLPRESMSRHLAAGEEGHASIVEYEGEDARLPWPVRDFNQAAGVKSLIVAPLHLPPKTLGWIAPLEHPGLGLRAALAAGVDRRDGTAGDPGALLQPARRSQPARGAAPGGAGGAQSHRARHPRHAGAGVRRDPHAVAGRAAHRRTEPAAGAGAQPRDRRRSGAHAPGRGAALGRGAAAAVGRARRRRRGARAHGRSRAPHQRRARGTGGRRTAGVRGRRRARDRRHRAGSADQCQPATRVPAASSSVPAPCAASGFACRLPTMAAA